MIQKKWLILLLSSYILDAIVFIGFRLLIGDGAVTNNNVVILVYSTQLVSFFMKSTFYGIIIYVFRFRPMLLTYGIVSTLALFAFMWYYISTVFGYRGAVVWNNFTLIFSIVSLIIAFIYAVDQTTTTLFKVTLLVSSLSLILFKTPVFDSVAAIAMRIFGLGYTSWVSIYIMMMYVQLASFGAITVLQGFFISKMDYA